MQENEAERQDRKSWRQKPDFVFLVMENYFVNAKASESKVVKTEVVNNTQEELEDQDFFDDLLEEIQVLKARQLETFQRD